MSDKQPEALRLADELDRVYGYPDTNAAATELRRLHEVNQELLGALRLLLRGICDGPDDSDAAMLVSKARAAIANATGEEA